MYIHDRVLRKYRISRSESYVVIFSEIICRKENHIFKRKYIFMTKICSGAGEIAQSVKCLPCRCEV